MTNGKTHRVTQKDVVFKADKTNPPVYSRQIKQILLFLQLNQEIQLSLSAEMLLTK